MTSQTSMEPGRSGAPAPAKPVLAGSTLVLAVRRHEVPVAQLGPSVWARELSELRTAGFDAVDLVDSWLSPAELGDDELGELRDVLAGCELTLAGVSVVRRSVIDPEDGERNLELTLRTVEAAAILGAPVVSIGFHRPLTAAQKAAPFWMAPAPEDDRTPETWALAVARVGQVAARARSLGVEVSLELHEGTLLDSPAGALTIIDRVGAENLGINPDLGNLLRVPAPLERGWEDLLRACLPRMNYWHVKNYARLEHPETGLVLTTPSPLAAGVIDYRGALRIALEHGYAGPICIEHYEGDALEAIASGRRYLEGVLRELGARG
jgi:sugar phosphate isomerase/epimerase